jgi:hypothetical protein
MHCNRHGSGIHVLPVQWRDIAGSTFSVRCHSLACLRDLIRIGLLARQVGDRPMIRIEQLTEVQEA